MTLPGRLVFTIASLLAVMRHLNAQLAYADGTIAGVTAHDARVQHLRTVPSVGPVTAALVATLDDAQRFRHAHQVETYLGLVPRELSSGETQRRGHITKAGPSCMRWHLIHVAVSILRRRPPQAETLHAWTLRIAARRAHRLVALAPVWPAPSMRCSGAARRSTPNTCHDPWSRPRSKPQRLDGRA